LREEVGALKRQLANARAAPGAAAGQREIARVKKMLDEAQAGAKRESSEKVAALQRQLKGARTRISEFRE
jgi:hypothetical protein